MENVGDEMQIDRRQAFALTGSPKLLTRRDRLS